MDFYLTGSIIATILVAVISYILGKQDAEDKYTKINDSNIRQLSELETKIAELEITLSSLQQQSKDILPPLVNNDDGGETFRIVDDPEYELSDEEWRKISEEWEEAAAKAPKKAKVTVTATPKKNNKKKTKKKSNPNTR